MFDYLQQFNNLPKELRDKVSSPSVMAALAELEKKYQVDLAMAVMKVMIKSTTLKNLPAYFISDFNLGQTSAESLVNELTAKIFVNAADYLGLKKEAKALDLDTDINLIISGAGLFLPSSDSVGRFKNILSTYLKGVRSKIAARDALTKSVSMGGLDLTPNEADRIFKVCEQSTFTSLEVNLDVVSKRLMPQTRLDKIIASVDNNAVSAEYDLKQAIASGQIKKAEAVVAPIKPIQTIQPIQPIKLDTSHELPIPEKQLDLPLTSETNKEVVAPEDKKIVSRSFNPVPPKAPLPALKSTPAPATVPASSPMRSPLVKQSPSVLIATPISAIKKPEKKLGFFGKIFKGKPKEKLAPVSKPVSSTKPGQPVKSGQSVKPLNNPVLEPIIKPVVPSVLIKPVPKLVPRPAPPIQKPIAASRPIFAPSISRHIMQDIKVVPKVMGPLEELQFLDLLNFRRLGKNPVEITAKIFSKVKLLEADGYDKMVAGVRAWRQSPVNRLYLKMVQEAIGQGITIKDLALVKQKDSKDYLNIEEIEAILAMNSKLVF